MMQATQDGSRHDSATFRDAMPRGLKFGFRRSGIWRSGAETGMRARRVVMRRPGFERLTNVGFVDRDYEIQTLAACTAN